MEKKTPKETEKLFSAMTKAMVKGNPKPKTKGTKTPKKKD